MSENLWSTIKTNFKLRLNKRKYMTIISNESCYHKDLPSGLQKRRCIVNGLTISKSKNNKKNIFETSQNWTTVLLLISLTPRSTFKDKNKKWWEFKSITQIRRDLNHRIRSLIMLKITEERWWVKSIRFIRIIECYLYNKYFKI